MPHTKTDKAQKKAILEHNQAIGDVRKILRDLRRIKQLNSISEYSRDYLREAMANLDKVEQGLMYRDDR
jgi:geranylgeranyl pyrophosphate synthase